LGSSLSWILFEEETPRLTARGDKKRDARDDIPYPVLPSVSRGIPRFARDGVLHFVRDGVPRMPKRGGSGVALSRLGIAKKVIWEDEALLEIRGGLKEAFYGLKGQGI
jgi:hypothetical protein